MESAVGAEFSRGDQRSVGLGHSERTGETRPSLLGERSRADHGQGRPCLARGARSAAERLSSVAAYGWCSLLFAI